MSTKNWIPVNRVEGEASRQAHADLPEGTYERVASTVFTPPALGYDPTLKPYTYDPALAKKLLSEVGYNGTPVKIWSVQTGWACRWSAPSIR